MPQKRSHSPSTSSPDTQFSSSFQITDRSSSFLALYSPTLSLSTLRSRSELSGAAHRIAAWRRPGTQKSIYPGAAPLIENGWDDDGESRAGRRVLSVMETRKVEGIIVVGRWWGGIMLGPVRFKHIEDVALGAIDAWTAEDTGAAGKKRKSDESAQGDPEKEKMVKGELVNELATRDEHIRILRTLLAEKRAALAKRKDATGDDTEVDKAAPIKRKDGENVPSNTTTPGASQASTKSEAPKPNYTDMPMATLRRLEQARDKTIGFVLAEIGKVERELGIEKKADIAAGEEAIPDGADSKEAGT